MSSKSVANVQHAALKLHSECSFARPVLIASASKGRVAQGGSEIEIRPQSAFHKLGHLVCAEVGRQLRRKHGLGLRAMHSKEEAREQVSQATISTPPPIGSLRPTKGLSTGLATNSSPGQVRDASLLHKQKIQANMLSTAPMPPARLEKITVGDLSWPQ